jgi:hypothetical protein
MTHCAQRLIGLFLVTTLASWGCDGLSGAPAASSSTTEAKVRGKVTRNGKPLVRAEIRFNPANVYRKSAPMATAMTGADGSYEVSTLVGENAVTLGGRAVRKNNQLQYTARTLDVKEGENTFDLSLP